MRDDELDAIDEFLTHAEARGIARPVIASGLRLHVHSTAHSRLRTGYSQELAEADMVLTRAITEYQFSVGSSTLDDVRERLREFHEAASACSTYAPFQGLTELIPPGGYSSACA